MVFVQRRRGVRYYDADCKHREKIRRQKKRRSRRGKEKMLKTKHARGEIKQMRKSPRVDSE